MKEAEDKKLNTGDVVIRKGRFLTWFDNFWYHYKWHSIIALFLVITILICSLQMCQKESYDIYVLYAGGHEIDRRSDNGDIPEYKTVVLSLNRGTEDFDEDGRVNVSLKDLFVLSADEIKEIENSEDDLEVNYALISENLSVLKETMLYSDYYVCFLSVSVYEQYKTVDEIEMFASLAPYVSADTEVKYYSDSAIYLSSTGFYSLPGICNMPTDTLICLKKASIFATHFNKKETVENFSRGERTITKILNYK